MGNILIEMDDVIAANRDKTRFKLKDKRRLSFDSLFGHVKVRRNYYLDRETGKYVYLLDQYLSFDGRKASKVLEKLLGYPVISHEGIRKPVLATEVIPKKKRN